MQSKIPLVFALAWLSGCVPAVTGSTYTDGRFWFSNVKSASDPAGGPRQDVLIVVDRDGTVIEVFGSNGIGTLQAVAGAVIPAAGQAAGSALVRPARNTTNVRMDVAGTGGAGGSAAGGSASATANPAP